MYPHNGKLRLFVKDIVEDARSGRSAEAYSQLFTTNKILVTTYPEDSGWVLFYYLRDNYRRNSPVECRQLLADYLKLKTNRPSLLHKQILLLAIRISRHYFVPDIYRFFVAWGPQFLEEVDYRSSELNGKTIEPLVVRLIRRIIYSPSSPDFNSLRLLFSNQLLKDDELKKLIIESIIAEAKSMIANQQWLRSWQILRTYLERFQDLSDDSEKVEIMEIACHAASYQYSEYLPWYVGNLAIDNVDLNVIARPISQLVGRAVEIIRKTPEKFSGSVGYIADKILSLSKQPEADNRLHYLAAELAFLAGDLQRAQNIAIPLYDNLKNNQKYLDLLAEIIPEIDVKLGLLMKSVRLRHDTATNAQRHFKIARLLLNKGFKAQAKEEFSYYAYLQRDHGHNIPREFYCYEAVLGKIEQPAMPVDINEPMYDHYMELAERYMTETK